MGLSGSTIASTFIKLLRINRDTMGAGGTASFIQDSADLDSALSISTTRVGIGTDTPSHSLHVFTTSGACTLKVEADAGGVGVDAILQLVDQNIFWNIYLDDTDDSLRFAYNHASTGDKMTILSNGKVGIGTASPAAPLEISTTPGDGGSIRLTASAPGIIWSDTGGSDHFRMSLDSADLRIDHCTEADGLFTPYTTPFCIQVGGNVGIGTAAPATGLHLYGADPAAGETLTLERAQATISGHELGMIQFRGSHTSASTNKNRVGAYIIAAATSSWAAADDPHRAPTDLRFHTQDNSDSDTLGTARMIIDQDGNVGIGTTSPDLQLEVSSEGTANTTTRIGVKAASLTTDDYSCGYLTKIGDADVHNQFMTYANNVDPGDGGGAAVHYTNFIMMRGPHATAGQINYYWPDKDGEWRYSSTASNIGNHTSGLLNASLSDERLKTISENPFPYGLEEINKLTPIRYKHNMPTSGPNEPDMLGLGAQSTESIIPEPVQHTEECLDGYCENENGKVCIPNSDRMDKLTMDYNQFIPVLVKAIQELSAKVTALENNNQTGENNNGESNQGSEDSGDDSSESSGEDSGGTEGSSDEASSSSESVSGDDSESSGSSGGDSSDDSEGGSGGDDNSGE